jgi:hypothetical protein
VGKRLACAVAGRDLSPIDRDVAKGEVAGEVTKLGWSKNVQVIVQIPVMNP